MNYFFAAIAGLAIGAAGAYLNYRITLAALEKGTSRALSFSNLIHTAVNIAILALIFLLRNILPFDFMVCIVAAAVGLSLCTIIYSFRAAKSARLSAPSAQENENVEESENEAEIEEEASEK